MQNAGKPRALVHAPADDAQRRFAAGEPCVETPPDVRGRHPKQRLEVGRSGRGIRVQEPDRLAAGAGDAGPQLRRPPARRGDAEHAEPPTHAGGIIAAAAIDHDDLKPLAGREPLKQSGERRGVIQHRHDGAHQHLGGALVCRAHGHGELLAAPAGIEPASTA